MPADVILVLPYPFSDHPSFPESILKRSLERAGFSVGILDTPYWQEAESFAALGKPNLCFAIVSGPLDSIVLNYTASRKRRKEDLYQFTGSAYFPGSPPSIKYKIRPDRTVLAFANLIKSCFQETPIIIGGMESSMRRFAHYDFQQQKIRRSILLDSRADILVTGRGEKQLVAIAGMLKNGVRTTEIYLPGTARMVSAIPENNCVILPSWESILKDQSKLMVSQQLAEQANFQSKVILQQYSNRYVLVNPAMHYTAADLQEAYEHPFTRLHPGEKQLSPALMMNLFSITSHIGCGGGCSFCSISGHEGKHIISRSFDSIKNEIETFQTHPKWQGIVSDIGGPTADMFGQSCQVAECQKPSCLFPQECPNFSLNQDYLKLLRKCRILPGVKKIFVGSGLRYDLLLKDPELLEEILRFHAGKFLRIAPEHTEDHILQLMGKPPFQKLQEFVKLFHSINRALKRKIALSPYLMVGHPGERWQDIVTMKKKLVSLDLKTTDVQIFTPTPGTLSTAMYVCGLDSSGQTIEVEREIKKLQARKNYLIR